MQALRERGRPGWNFRDLQGHQERVSFCLKSRNGGNSCVGRVVPDEGSRKKGHRRRSASSRRREDRRQGRLGTRGTDELASTLCPASASVGGVVGLDDVALDAATVSDLVAIGPSPRANVGEFFL